MAIKSEQKIAKLENEIRALKATYSVYGGAMLSYMSTSPIYDVAEDTTLEASHQNKILKELQHEEILEVKMVGKPAERYIKFDERRLSCALGTYERRFDEDLKGVNNE